MNTQSKPDICEALPQVALDFMNTVHCEEVMLTQELLQALNQKQDDRVDALLDEWIDHTIRHFAREERLMIEYRFPPYPVHEGEHARALEIMRSVRANWQAIHDYHMLENYIRQDWQSWLTNHIATMDTVTANFLFQFDIEVDLDLD